MILLARSEDAIKLSFPRRRESRIREINNWITIFMGMTEQ